MARYQSRLKSVLKTRERSQEKAQMAFVMEGRLLSQEEDILRKLLEASESARNHLKKSRISSAAEIQLYHDFIGHQKIKIQHQEKKIAIQAEVCEGKRTVLEEATREKKTIENLEAKQRATYLATLKKNDALLLDELAGQMKWRQR